MIDRLLHTPDGVRDTLNDECQKKQSLERELHKVLVSFGYRDLETPTFEFFDVFGREVGTTPSQELYKFFDREGNTLVLPLHRPGRFQIFPGGGQGRPPLLPGKHLY